MITFLAFLTEASVRQGLPHITTMDHDQFNKLTDDSTVKLHNITEKTDGSTMLMGHDEHGFYTQSSGSGSERMRSPDDYVTRATRRAAETGKPLDLTAAQAFAHVHHNFSKNKMLQEYLQRKAGEAGGETQLRGEMFYKPFARPSETPGEVKFVGTSYDPSRMANTGKFVIHSQLPENKNHEIDHIINNLSDSEINFDHDMIAAKPSDVDVSDERKAFEGLNHELLNTRTKPSNKEAKLAETQKFEAIKKAVSDKVDTKARSMKIQPKWGSGTEGFVVHPAEGSNDPRFKITSDAFRSYKADPENALKFKQRNK